MGSIVIARQAGIEDDRTAVKARSSATEQNVARSVVPTPNRRCAIMRVSARAAAVPVAMPRIARRTLWPTTSHHTLIAVEVAVPGIDPVQVAFRVQDGIGDCHPLGQPGQGQALDDACIESDQRALPGCGKIGGGNSVALAIEKYDSAIADAGMGGLENHIDGTGAFSADRLARYRQCRHCRRRPRQRRRVG
jgi:hypothetical protein